MSELFLAVLNMSLRGCGQNIGLFKQLGQVFVYTHKGSIHPKKF